MCASALWLFSSSTRNIAWGSDSRIVPSSTMASSFGLGRVGLFRTVTNAAQYLLRTREAEPGRLAMLSPEVGNAKPLPHNAENGPWRAGPTGKNRLRCPAPPLVGAPSPPCSGPTLGV